MDSVQMVSRTPYSLKVVCLKQLLSLRVYKLQEDETAWGSLQAVILAANPAAAPNIQALYKRLAYALHICLHHLC